MSESEAQREGQPGAGVRQLPGQHAHQESLLALRSVTAGGGEHHLTVGSRGAREETPFVLSPKGQLDFPGGTKAGETPESGEETVFGAGCLPSTASGPGLCSAQHCLVLKPCVWVVCLARSRHWLTIPRFPDLIPGDVPIVCSLTLQVTTFSRLLTSHDGEVLGSEVNGRALNPTILSLQQFDTEHSFLKEVR